MTEQAIRMYFLYENNLISAEELAEWCAVQGFTPYDIVIHITMMSLLND